MERHTFNAQKIVEYLKSVDLVDKIYFPGMDGKPLPNRMSAPGGMVSFTIKANLDTVKAFAMATRLFFLAESLGGVESLINHPALMTHASAPKAEREARGVTDNLVRLSVGVENIDDLISDLAQAFETIRAGVAKR
jgi:cystathionine beta-lyase/cystathionine gamma-synthase